MGAALAYYLSLEQKKPLVIEQTDVAAGASGKAGGFLALDWCEKTPVRGLARKSFELHAKLQDDLKMDVGYRKVNTISATNQRIATLQPHDAMPKWLDGKIGCTSVMGTENTTAQVHPYLLTSALLKRAVEQGATFRKGTVQSLQIENGVATGVVVDGSVIPADIVIIAMGPWTALARAWLPIPHISAVKAHSIVLSPPEPVSATAVFLTFETKSQDVLDPEIYPRPDGTVYLCGVTSDIEVPAAASDVVPSDGACETLEEVAHSVSSVLAKAKTTVKQACLLPTSPDDLPLIGAIPGVAGTYICSGHSCWGILNAPASALGLTELIVHGEARSVDLTPFDPKRFALKNKKRK